jgi:hypothetical protein
MHASKAKSTALKTLWSVQDAILQECCMTGYQVIYIDYRSSLRMYNMSDTSNISFTAPICEREIGIPQAPLVLA